MIASAGFTILLDSVFPRNCIICGSGLNGRTAVGTHVCPACVPPVEYRIGKRCSVCSKQLISEHELCMRCRKREYGFNRNVSLYPYTDSPRILLQSYKFDGYRKLADLFAKELFIAAAAVFGTGLPVVPVPSRKRTKRARGLDHIEYISIKLKREFGMKIIPLLARRGNRAQKTLRYEERLLNMRGSIIPAGRKKAIPREAILLDDVFTTGATAHECTMVLKQMGVSSVNVLTIALD